MSTLSAYLTQHTSLTITEVEEVANHFDRIVLKKGDFFIKQGRIAQRMGYIEKGMLRIYAESEEKEVTQWISTPGYFVTELSSFVFQKPSRLHLQALEETEMYVIEKEVHQKLCQQLPAWNEVDKKFIAKCFVMLEDRIFSHLYMTAEERYKQLMEINPVLFNSVPLQYLASMLGMTPETLSRLRRK